MDERTSASSSMTNTVGALRDVIRGLQSESVERRTPRQMNDTGGGLCEASPFPRSKYIAETKQLSCDRMIGTLHAFQNVSDGGLNNMEAPQSDIRDGHDPAIQLRETSIRELQDAVSQNLAFFYKRAYRYVGDTHDAEDVVQDAILSLPTNTWISSKGRRKSRPGSLPSSPIAL